MMAQWRCKKFEEISIVAVPVCQSQTVNILARGLHTQRCWMFIDQVANVPVCLLAGACCVSTKVAAKRQIFETGSNTDQFLINTGWPINRITK